MVNYAIMWCKTDPNAPFWKQFTFNMWLEPFLEYLNTSPNAPSPIFIIVFMFSALSICANVMIWFCFQITLTILNFIKIQYFTTFLSHKLKVILFGSIPLIVLILSVRFSFLESIEFRRNYHRRHYQIV